MSSMYIGALIYLEAKNLEKKTCALIPPSEVHGLLTFLLLCKDRSVIHAYTSSWYIYVNFVYWYLHHGFAGVQDTGRQYPAPMELVV